MPERDWECRFSQLTAEIAVSMGFVFRGAENAAVSKLIPWPQHLVYERGEPPSWVVRKLYVEGSPGRTPGVVSFEFERLVRSMRTVLREDCVEITLWRRCPKAACAREGEGALWGFGRPHPAKPDFKPHPELAGPVVDYRPGQQPGWKFKPIFVGVKPVGGAAGYLVKIQTHWMSGGILILARLEPHGDVPPELIRWMGRTLRLPERLPESTPEAVVRR